LSLLYLIVLCADENIARKTLLDEKKRILLEKVLHWCSTSLALQLKLNVLVHYQVLFLRFFFLLQFQIMITSCKNIRNDVLQRDLSEWIRRNVPMNTLQVIFQWITCTGTNNQIITNESEERKNNEHNKNGPSAKHKRHLEESWDKTEEDRAWFGRLFTCACAIRLILA